MKCFNFKITFVSLNALPDDVPKKLVPVPLALVNLASTIIIFRKITG